MNIDVIKYDRIVTNIFSPIYSVIAEQIIEKTKVEKGLCIDIGSGTGYLGLAMAKRLPELKVILFDMLQEMLDIADKNILKNDIKERVRTEKGIAERLPYKDNSIDLVISRGSIFYWDDKSTGLSEILRVLKPGAHAYIGGGFGNEQLLSEIIDKMSYEDPEWVESRKKRKGLCDDKNLVDIIKMANIKDYEIIKENAGLWVIFKK